MHHLRITHRVAALAATTALVGTLVACGSDSTPNDAGDGVAVVTDAVGAADSALDQADTEVGDLAQTLRDEGLDSAAGVVEQIDVSQLVGDNDFTFFAPNDEAFTSLSADQMADLLTDPGQILDTLRNHTLDSAYTAEELTSMDSVETRAGETLPVSVDGDTVMIGDVTVVKADISFGNGEIHVVDGFLLPS